MSNILSKFSGIFSRIASALEDHAVSHPTHFPAVSSAKAAQEGKMGDEPLHGDEAVENKDDPQPR